MSNRIFTNDYAPNYYSQFQPRDLILAGDGGFWYDFGDWDYMFQDTAMTVKVTAAGQAVAAVKDKSANARHVFQSDGAKRPLAAVVSGNKCLDFVAASQHSLLSSNAGTALATHWGCIVFERETATANQRLLSISTSGTDVATANDIAFTAGGAGQHFLIRAGATATDAYVNGAGNSPFAFYEYQRLAALTSVWKDHVPGVNDAASLSMNTYSTGKNCIGIQSVTNAPGAAGAFDGKIYQMLHCGTIPDSDGKSAVETWFNQYRY